MDIWHIFAMLANDIQAPLNQNVSQVADNVMSGIRRPFIYVATIYLALAGWRMMSGQINEPIRDVWGRIGRLIFVGVAITAGSYTTWVTNVFLNGLSTMVSSWVTGANTTVSAGSFDHVLGTAFVGGLAVWKNVSWHDFGTQLLVGLYWIVAAISVALCFLIWLVAQVIIALLIAIGPLMIAGNLFPATRSLFERWIGALISCVLLQAMAVILVTVLVGAVNTMLAKIGAPNGNPYDQIATLLGAVVLFLICAAVLCQLPGAATAVAGGLHFHAGVLARATYGTSANYARIGAVRLGTATRGGAVRLTNAVRTRLPPSIPLSRSRTL